MKTNLSSPALASLIQQALFSRWFKELEELIIEETGYSLQQLPPFKYLDMFEGGFSVEETSKTVGLIIDELA